MTDYHGVLLLRSQYYHRRPVLPILRQAVRSAVTRRPAAVAATTDLIVEN